jgi:hypothetical protein
MGTWESTRTPETSKLNGRYQNTSHWGVFYIIGKLSKCRCQKWVCMSHLDIYSTSYDKKKGRESNWQFDSQPLKARNRSQPQCVQVECNTSLESSWQELQVCFRPCPNRRSEQKVIVSQNCGSPNQDSLGTPPWESRDKKPFRCRCCGEA